MVEDEFGLVGKWLVTIILAGLSIVVIVGVVHFTLAFSESIANRLTRFYHLIQPVVSKVGIRFNWLPSTIKRVIGPLEPRDFVMVSLFVVLALLVVVLAILAGLGAQTLSVAVLFGAYTLLVIIRGFRVRLRQALEHDTGHVDKIEDAISKLEKYTASVGDSPFPLTRVLSALANRFAVGLRSHRVREAIEQEIPNGDLGTPVRDVVGKLLLLGIIHAEHHEDKGPISINSYSLRIGDTPPDIVSRPYSMYYLSQFGIQVIDKLRETEFN